MSLISSQARPFVIIHDTLYFVGQSPSVQFIYWQLSTSKQMLLREHFQMDWRSLTPSLRFHEVDDPSKRKLQEPVAQVLELLLPPGESCFISGLKAGHAYFASLGVRNEHGQFLPILQSNTIHIPAYARPVTSDLPDSDSLFIYQPAPLHFSQVTPEAYAYFSAYSVYIPKNTYLVDMESGGDTD